MKFSKSLTTKNNQHGMSMVELMVSLGISGFLVMMTFNVKDMIFNRVVKLEDKVEEQVSEEVDAPVEQSVTQPTVQTIIGTLATVNLEELSVEEIEAIYNSSADIIEKIEALVKADIEGDE